MRFYGLMEAAMAELETSLLKEQTQTAALHAQAKKKQDESMVDICCFNCLESTMSSPFILLGCLALPSSLEFRCIMFVCDRDIDRKIPKPRFRVSSSSSVV